MSDLGTSPAFQARTFDEIENAANHWLRAELVSKPAKDHDFVAQGHRAQVSATTLWHCSYQVPISLRLPDSDGIRLQIPIHGAGITHQGNRTTPVTANKACLSSGNVRIDFGPDYRQLVWLAPQASLKGKLRALTGRDGTDTLSFAPELDLATNGAGIAHLVNCLAKTLEDAGSRPGAALMLAELEQALLTALLVSARHSHSHQFEEQPLKAASWQVVRAENYLEANWNKPVNIEDLAAATGTSVRSLFRTFRQSRGCTPMEFLREIRLRHAKEMLTAEDGATSSVTEVAMACGFTDPSNFSRAFSASFGMAPSTLLRRPSPMG